MYRMNSEAALNLLVYSTPMWAARGLLLFCLAVACLFLYLGWNLKHLAPNDPQAFKYFFYFLGLAFLSAALRPLNWQPWIHFRASAEGLAFPADVPLRRNSEWLLVPWSRVGEIRLARLLNNASGISLELQLSDEEKDAYFPSKRILEDLFGNTATTPGYTTVGYANMFFNRQRAVEMLKQMKQQYS